MEKPVLFGRYRLLERAGSGGSAEVWRALDERTGEEVALKRLHPIVFASESGRRRLVREFRSLRDLRHPNIVRVRDLEMVDDDAAIVLDYVPGRSLRERLAEEGALPQPEAVRIAGRVAAALAAAHAAGLVHRDVSPGNVLLGPDGDVHLTDFGIAHQAADETAVTATGTLVGTLRYVAPEQLRGEPASPASDLYGLAAVTYEMLAGEPPFAAGTPVELVEAQARGAAPIDGVDAALDGAVRQGLAPEPAARPASVEAFVGNLSDAIDGRRTEPTGVPLAAGSAVAAAGVETARATGLREQAAARPHRRRMAAAPIAAAAALALGGLVLAAAVMAPGDPAAAERPAGDGTTPTPTAPASTQAPTVEQVADDGDDDADDDVADKQGGKGKDDNKGKDKGKDKDD